MTKQEMDQHEKLDFVVRFVALIFLFVGLIVDVDPMMMRVYSNKNQVNYEILKVLTL
jgi:hypothetical protein